MVHVGGRRESVLAWRDELNVLQDQPGPLFVPWEPRLQAGVIHGVGL
jgi:hypothetical protein